MLEILQNLLSIEQYFSFPGTSVVSRIIKSVNKGELKATSNKVAEIVQLLVSENYREPFFEITNGEDISSNGSRSSDNASKEATNSGISRGSNYFEVLYVEEMSANEEIFLKNKIKKLIPHNSTLNYDIVVQQSFQDALICLFFN